MQREKKIKKESIYLNELIFGRYVPFYSFFIRPIGKLMIIFYQVFLTEISEKFRILSFWQLTTKYGLRS